MKTEPEDSTDASKMPEWERYERLVAQLIADQLSTTYCVTPNARVRGKISERDRQIDVLIDQRHTTDNGQRIIVDAKARTRQIDVTHVEAFRGLMADVEATHGYLVCPNGYSAAAERRAQKAVSIRLLPLDRLENFDPTTWPKCHAPNCRNGRVFWDGYPALDLMLASAADPISAPRRVTFVHYVGKCDRCGRFHVRCTSCGDMLSLAHTSDDHGMTCSCRLPWFWLASIEQDEQGGRSAELHLITGAERIWTVDRRSL